MQMELIPLSEYVPLCIFEEEFHVQCQHSVGVQGKSDPKMSELLACYRPIGVT